MYTQKGIESRDSNRYLYSGVHGKIIHNGQKVENNASVCQQMNG